LKLDCLFFRTQILLPETVKEIYLTCDNDFINDIPEHIEKIYIEFYDDTTLNNKVYNLPKTLKEIIIEKKIYKKYIKISHNSNIIISVQKKFFSNILNK
jgi:hypothetical protein